MQTLVKSSFVEVVGTIWMPAITAAYRYDLRQYDIDNMKDDEGNIDRDCVEEWLSKNAGDFQSITDFHADIETDKGNVLIDWESEENEFTYVDCMYPSED